MENGRTLVLKRRRAQVREDSRYEYWIEDQATGEQIDEYFADRENAMRSLDAAVGDFERSKEMEQQRQVFPGVRTGGGGNGPQLPFMDDSADDQSEESGPSLPFMSGGGTGEDADKSGPALPGFDIGGREEDTGPTLPGFGMDESDDNDDGSGFPWM